MIRGIVFGIILGVLGVAACGYWYFSSGRAPVAVNAPEMLFERKLARLGLHAYLDKLPHTEPQVPADERNLLAGAKVYKENCSVCHGVPDGTKTAIADGMFPKPPQLFKGTGVTDDDAWESYWKAADGIRLTGMPGFKSHLTETQLWQVAVLVKNADKISPAVKAELVGAPGSATEPGAARKKN
jgi:mono/diheme cytochrome c family protein